MDERTEQIKKFWDDRAKQFGENAQATLGEVDLRKLEINFMINCIKKLNPERVLDVGCGNGYSTKIYAKKFSRPTKCQTADEGIIVGGISIHPHARGTEVRCEAERQRRVVWPRGGTARPSTHQPGLRSDRHGR